VSLQREQRRNYWYSYQGQNLTFLLYFTPVANWAPRKMFSVAQHEIVSNQQLTFYIKCSIFQ
jgi:hypothetical protein